MRLIDADEVKRFYETYFKDLDNGVHWSRNDIIMNLDCIETADIVPVIRCKDCEWYEMGEEETYCRELGIFNTDDDFYCGYAERRTDE